MTTRTHDLKPCPGCARHARVTEASCPFCEHPFDASFRVASSRRPTPGRLSRAAIFALGAGSAGVTTACASEGVGDRPLAGAAADATSPDASEGFSSGDDGDIGSLGALYGGAVLPPYGAVPTEPIVGCPTGIAPPAAPPDGGCDAACDGTCTGGRCLVSLTSAATSRAEPIALGAGAVFWTQTNEDTVMQVPIDGGDAGLFASGQGNPGAIVVDSANVYWTANGMLGSASLLGSGGVMQAALDGGAAFPLATGQADPNAVAVDATHVYWTNGGDGTANGSVMKAPIGGGDGGVTLAANRQLPSGIAVDSNSVYWVERGGAQVLKAPVEGGDGGVTLLATLSTPTGTAEVPASIAVDGASVYWTNPAAGTVMKVPIDGGLATVLAAFQCAPGGIAVDATSVYWTDAVTNGAVMKVALDGGGGTVVLASGFDTPASVAVDSTSLYLGSLFGAVMKLTPK
jgi:hypothetical protein